MTAVRESTQGAVAVARWRLALFVRSLRFVPPLLGELVAILVLFSTRPQSPSSAVSVSAVTVFVIAGWCSLLASAGLSGSGRDITVISAGRGPTLAGELLADVVAAVVAAVVMLGGSSVVVRPAMGAGPWLAAGAVVAASGVAGSALGLLISSLRLDGPPRFVLAIGAVCLTLARPALADGRLPAQVVALVVPPVLVVAKALDDGYPDAVGGALLVAVACVVWAAVAIAVTAAVGRRRIDRPPVRDR